MQGNKISVFITSCELGENAWRNQEYKLKELYKLSDKRFSLTDSPESADIILVGNLREENWGEKTLRHELISKYPDRCFSLSQDDKPLFLNRGIYTSNSRSVRTLGRVRTGSYTLYPDQYSNPFIKAHRISDNDFSDKEYLFSFIGRDSHSIRRIIFNLEYARQDILIEDSSSFKLWATECEDKKLGKQQYYYDKLLRSKFSLCPRGVGPCSLRLFESMMLQVAPVIISDAWKFPKGPKWNEFSIVIKEKHIRSVEKIIQDREGEHVEMGRLAGKAFAEYFSEAAYFNYVIDSCLDLKSKQLIPETLYWRLNLLTVLILKAKFRISRELSI
jgi:hypothetical protein